MKKLILFLILISTLNIFSQVNINSAYLLNPELAIGYVDSCASFWVPVWDQTRGGFYTNVSKTGAPLTSWGTNKDMITQSRNAYGLSRAYMLTGNRDYLEYANKALRFMYDHAWDKVNGGWINGLDINGNPTSPTENKTAFFQHYALLGISSYYEATNDSLHGSWLEDTYTDNNILLWDNRENFYGYFDFGNYNWSNKSGKSFNATVDAITTHLLSLYLMQENEYILEDIHKVTENILDYLVSSMDEQAIGFAEEYNSNWEIDNSETMAIMGHVLKAAWCLARVHQLDSNQTYIDAAEKLIDDVLTKGYDSKFGGPYKDYNRVTGEMLMWGNPDTAKAWWQMEQAIVAGLQMYNITGEEKYLKMADETTNFFMTHFVDHVYGEVYENRTRYGNETWGEHKGNGFKAGYHSIELGYYLYLYGKLLLHKEPVQLYYYIEPSGESMWRTIHLNPIAMNLHNLSIQSVELDGAEYTNFDMEKRLLRVDQYVGGEFKVTFYIDDTPNSVVDDQIYLTDFVLEQNYPNPFNPSTKIKYSIGIKTHVTLSIYNALGQKIANIIDQEQQKGNYEVEFNATGLSSGIYFYKLIAGNYMGSKKMVLLR